MIFLVKSHNVIWFRITEINQFRVCILDCLCNLTFDGFLSITQKIKLKIHAVCLRNQNA